MSDNVSCNHCIDGQILCIVCRGGRKAFSCPDCSGLGLYYDLDGDKSRSCPRCEGEGYLDASECTDCLNGFVDCEVCDGSGELLESDCQTCGGSAQVRCFECTGTGEVENEEDELDLCPECDGEGWVVCSDCE
ncbi:hypothetical protein VSF3289_02700 [Vibrio scophthalmi]|uniref:Molecular chaperone DnaJ n=1 Tax=Vibrio scophthalmi TaxID=45658 RepID=A0A1E3WRK6_9VIBR|nr:hypothetical protein VSF3289_02700 [Vibrio scophthalmi]